MEYITGFGSVLINTVVPFLILITIVVFFHELGHFLVGRWVGAGVKVFSIGFGNEIFGWTDKHGTRWRLSLIPLGGYVKFEGDEGVASTPDREALEEMPVEQYSTTLASKNVAQRAAVIAAGPIANFLLAMVIFTLMFAFYGRPVTKPQVDGVTPASAAAEAGFQVGDLIKSIDGTPIVSFDDIQVIVISSAEIPLKFVVDRNGVDVELIATPKLKKIKGMLGRTARIGRLGIQRKGGADSILIKQYSPLAAVVEGVSATWSVIKQTGNFIWDLLRGRQDTDQLGGPIMIAQLSGIAAEQGPVFFLRFVALISVSIGLLNLMPIPMLDGGHLLFYAAEAIRGKPLSSKVQDVGFMIGFVLVLLLMALVFWNDGSSLFKSWLSS